MLGQGSGAAAPESLRGPGPTSASQDTQGDLFGRNEGGQASDRAEPQAKPTFLPGHQPQPEGDQRPGCDTVQQGLGPTRRSAWLVGTPSVHAGAPPTAWPRVFSCQEAQAYPPPTAPLAPGMLFCGQAQGCFEWPTREAVYVAKAAGGISALDHHSGAREIKSSHPVCGSSTEFLIRPRAQPQPLPPFSLGALCWPECQLAGRRRWGPGPPCRQTPETAEYNVCPTRFNPDHRSLGKGLLKGAAPWKTTLSCK